MSALRRVLITGAYGFVGSALARACLDRGDRVCVLRRSEQPTSALVLEGSEARCTVVDGNVLVPEALDAALGGQSIDTVFHLAAQPIVAEALRAPSQSFDVNVRGTWLLLEACQRHDVARTVVASTIQAYGQPSRVPIDEQLPLDARQPYALTKACADLIARCWWHAYGLPVATARFSNVYGGGDRNLSRLVPGAVAAALRGERPVIRSDGSPQRDCFYVEDAAAAYLAIADVLEADPADARGEAFNAGSGASRSVLEIVQLVCEAVGTVVEPEVRGTPLSNSQVERPVIDYGKLHEATGWEPRVALEDGIERTVQWYRRYPEALAGY